MILSRISAHIRAQHWTAIAIDFVIVVVGVYVGLQVNLWNEARVESLRRQQIIDSLVTNLNDSISVQDRFTAEIGAGLAEWKAAYGRGDRPAPYYYRISGSDKAPDVWSTFQQMQLTELFDPVTLFDLMFYYSELDGIGQKCVRYVTFVEDEVLPGLDGGKDAFYDADGNLRPGFRANMERLRDYQHEIQQMTAWARCLVYRLESKQSFKSTCRRSGYHLDGMDERATRPDARPAG